MTPRPPSPGPRPALATLTLALLLATISGCGVVGFFRYGVTQAHFGKLRIGHCAPDATVVDQGGHPIALASHFGERPLVLIFGSFT